MKTFRRLEVLGMFIQKHAFFLLVKIDTRVSTFQMKETLLGKGWLFLQTFVFFFPSCRFRHFRSGESKKEVETSLTEKSLDAMSFAQKFIWEQVWWNKHGANIAF